MHCVLGTMTAGGTDLFSALSIGRWTPFVASNLAKHDSPLLMMVVTITVMYGALRVSRSIESVPRSLRANTAMPGVGGVTVVCIQEQIHAAKPSQHNRNIPDRGISAEFRSQRL